MPAPPPLEDSPSPILQADDGPTGGHVERRALITGITGQDGLYLAEHLLALGYRVCGMIRGQNNPKRALVERTVPAVNLREGDLMDATSLLQVIETSEPDEVYNLGALTVVAMSFREPLLTAEIDGLGVLRMLEAIRTVNPKIRFCQASTSEMFGKAQETPQNELTPFHPRSPYGVAKAYGHNIVTNYRESYGMFACSAILYNHESERRAFDFVTRKITDGAAAIAAGKATELRLGNLDAKRDWGHAEDYVRAMHLMLQHHEPDDYVVATGESHTVEEFCALAFERLGLDWHDHVVLDPAFVRPPETDLLVGDATKARRALRWEPRVSFPQLVARMVDHDVQRHGVPVRQAAACRLAS